MEAPSGSKNWRRCEIASKQSGNLVSHHQHHMAEAWRKFEAEARQMPEAEMNASHQQYGEKKHMESNAMMQQMRQAEGMIMEQKREIAVMRSYMASKKAAAKESAMHANQVHRFKADFRLSTGGLNRLHLLRSSTRRRWFKA